MNTLIETAIFTLLFFLPAGIANSAPVIASKISFLKPFDHPADFGLTLKGERILGSHKTIRGFISGIFVAILVVYLQRYFYNSFDTVSTISDQFDLDYSQINAPLWGFLLGFGGLAGDSIKSFFKRRVNVKPGQPWFPFDQLDYILGGFLFTAMYKTFPIEVYIMTVAVWFGLHLLFTLIGYLLGLKDAPI